MNRAQSASQRAFDSNSLAGLVLLGATIASLAVSNSALSPYYDNFLLADLDIRLAGNSIIHKPLLHWINEGLMAIFFLFIGLEIKREFREGNLASPKRAVLPLIAAVGGMAAPSIIYLSVTSGDAIATRGWAIPAATDIAFALGILALLGDRVPISLKVFLSAVAVIDDLGAVIIISLFYTDQLSAPMLVSACASVALLAALNVLGIRNLGVYLIVGASLWFAVLNSGIHATLAGVIVAAFIPLARNADHDRAPLDILEHAIKPWVLFVIVPLFAFANAGLRLWGIEFEELVAPATLGIVFGLVAGKVFGVTGASWLAVKLGLAQLPPSIDWTAMLGIGLLCGVGFTMSLFIGSLAFEYAGADYQRSVRLGVLIGSTVSATAAIILLKHWLRKRGATHPQS